MARKRKHGKHRTVMRKHHLRGMGKAGTAIKRAFRTLGSAAYKHRGAIKNAIKKSGVVGNVANAIASRYTGLAPVAGMVKQAGYGFYPKGRGMYYR